MIQRFEISTHIKDTLVKAIRNVKQMSFLLMFSQWNFTRVTQACLRSLQKPKCGQWCLTAWECIYSMRISFLMGGY